jgi:hypothetical protein
MIAVVRSRFFMMRGMMGGRRGQSDALDIL